MGRRKAKMIPASWQTSPEREQAEATGIQPTERPTYHVCYKHPEHGSDHLGCDYPTSEAAHREIEAIQRDPGRAGWAGWLKDATLWVSDDQGNLY